MNSACNYGEERLAGLLYEDCEAAEMIELRAHLATCAGCREELEGLHAARDLLSAWPNAVNVPRMVYVHERPDFWTSLRRWTDALGRLGTAAVLKPAMAAAVTVLVLALSVALLDVRVADDGRMRIGLPGGPVATEQVNEAAAEPVVDTVSREELDAGLAQAVSYLEELFRSRREDERRVLLAAIDERMQEQGLVMSQQLRGAVDAAFTDIESRHENDLGLVFSAVDELGIITGTELQRMNTILASLMQRSPDEEE